MRNLDSTVVERMRTMVRDGESVSSALKSLHRILPNEQQTKITLIAYTREAFCLSLQEASPIAGWNAQGTGEIQDDRLDELVMPAVEDHQDQWNLASAE